MATTPASANDSAMERPVKVRRTLKGMALAEADKSMYQGWELDPDEDSQVLVEPWETAQLLEPHHVDLVEPAVDAAVEAIDLTKEPEAAWIVLYYRQSILPNSEYFLPTLQLAAPKELLWRSVSQLLFAFLCVLPPLSLTTCSQLTCSGH